MPRYEHDPTKVAAALTILPKDDYELKIGKPKAFERTAKAGHQSYGLRFPLVVANGPQENKKTMYSIYLHSDGGAQMAKRFQMAVAGLTVNEANEKVFDAAAAGQDWSFDPETGEVGAAWAAYEGNHVCVDLDVEIVQNDKGDDVQSQVWGTWRPLSAPAAA